MISHTPYIQALTKDSYRKKKEPEIFPQVDLDLLTPTATIRKAVYFPLFMLDNGEYILFGVTVFLQQQKGKGSQAAVLHMPTGGMVQK